MSGAGADTTNGITISFGPLASTIDVPGFAAVVYDVVAEITDIGELTKNWETDTYVPYTGPGGSRASVQKKTSYTRSPITFTAGLIDGDVGQLAVEAANDVDTCYSVRLVRQGGGIIYFSTQVSGFSKSFPNGGHETITMTFLPQSDGVTA
ncbi:MAG TPA: hypothetical protein EYN54_02095 [Methylococcaceae bacterium]|nr:hypothetical protein [Methylococcaceae bacterium]